MLHLVKVCSIVFILLSVSCRLLYHSSPNLSTYNFNSVYNSGSPPEAGSTAPRDATLYPLKISLPSNFSVPSAVYYTDGAPHRPGGAAHSPIPASPREEIDVTEEEALTQYLVDHQTGFYRLAYSILKNPDEALDAVQTAVCRALERQDGLRDTGALRTWFYRILVNTCRDALRHRGREVPFPEDLEPSREDPEPADDTLIRRVEALPPEMGMVVKLRFYEELSLKEISQITGQNLSTVKSRLYAGLKKLRVAMEGAEI